MNDQDSQYPRYTCFHWGTYQSETRDGKLVALNPIFEDPDPSPIANGYLDTLDNEQRIRQPMVRKSWLQGGPGTAGELRGEDEFVPVSWDEAERLVAAELRRVIDSHGNESIFAGSYGWASAGRFHHAQGHLKRFLNLLGGFTKSVNTYSLAAGEVILPHVLGSVKYIYGATHWQSIIEHCDLLVAFGGLPVTNAQIGQGGVGQHRCKPALLAAQHSGVEFVNVSPLRSDVLPELESTWLALRPSTDTALMLALAWVLINEALYDVKFIARYTVGFERFAAYVTGDNDGIAKDPQWASAICGVSAQDIVTLALRMTRGRTMIALSWSLTRQDHGEQPFWLGTVLAAMLGQIGLPGGGVGFGYGATNTVGLERSPVRFQALPQGHNPVATFIPVARITELLENPGAPFTYNGAVHHYPDIRLVWWAGGNPFHHHQDLNRLRRAWAKPETVIANEWCWNALAQHADIVLPCTTTLEREDINLGPRDPYLVYMAQAVAPVAQARDDYAIFRGISRQLGIEDAYTEGRDTSDWLAWLYKHSREKAQQNGVAMPELNTLKREGFCKLAIPEEPFVMLAKFRTDPVAYPLKTPSGKIEIFSEVIAGFGLSDCPGHPYWMEPVEWLGSSLSDDYPLHLISNQPRNKLHSQLDHSAVSQADRPNGYEPVYLHPQDAAKYDITDGDVVRVFNQRGACLGEARLTKDLRRGVIKMSTGAWLAPDGNGVCQGGNPNVLTVDKGTSGLAQGPVAHSCLVEVIKV